jgi:PadR family transcriptional regulator, regulatory protein PadR
MYICLMYSKEILKGTLKPIILKLLQEQNRMYGYEITQRVKELTEGKINITEGALYPLLHKLEAEGVVTTDLENIGKRVRKYYKLTSDGSTIAQDLVEEFLDFMVTIKHVLDPNLKSGYGLSK